MRVPASLRVLVLVLIAACAASCGDDDGTGTAPSDPLLAVSVFSGTLEVGQTSSLTFNVVADGTTRITLGSLLTAPESPTAAIVSLGLGRPADGACSVTTAVETGQGFKSQLSASVTPGDYCVQVADIGNLAGPVTFAVRIVHP
jgi:hypothetical protein